MDKNQLLAQLAEKLRLSSEGTLRFAVEARTEAKTGAARAVNLAAGTRQRLASAQAAFEAVSDFKAPNFRRGDRIGLGAIVEVENEASGRTLFIAPAGAGEELTGPDGDGFLTVVTPASPIGKALMGKRVGDTVDLMVKGEVSEWSIAFAA